MPVDFIKQRKKQRYLILIVLLILGISGFVLWWGYFREEKTPLPVGPAVPSAPKEIKINFEILESPFLKEMQPFIETPAYEGEVGRENPFLPY